MKKRGTKQKKMNQMRSNRLQRHTKQMRGWTDDENEQSILKTNRAKAKRAKLKKNKRRRN